MNRAEDLRTDYDRLGVILAGLGKDQAAAAAAIARERRLIAVELERLEVPEEAALVDQLAAKRSDPGASRPPSRRRKSG